MKYIRKILVKYGKTLENLLERTSYLFHSTISLFSEITVNLSFLTSYRPRYQFLASFFNSVGGRKNRPVRY